jgi:hypothetical protein
VEEGLARQLSAQEFWLQGVETSGRTAIPTYYAYGIGRRLAVRDYPYSYATPAYASGGKLWVGQTGSTDDYANKDNVAATTKACTARYGGDHQQGGGHSNTLENFLYEMYCGGSSMNFNILAPGPKAQTRVVGSYFNKSINQ